MPTGAHASAATTHSDPPSNMRALMMLVTAAGTTAEPAAAQSATGTAGTTAEPAAAQPATALPVTKPTAKPAAKLATKPAAAQPATAVTTAAQPAAIDGRGGTQQPATTVAKATVQNLNVVIANPIVVIGCCCMCWVAAFIFRRHIYNSMRGEKNGPVMVVTGDLVVTAGPPAFV
ncbi:hypothetical protein T492DRAFT_854244 [Pavlovales sp. CCMP2436]|nr:hypothetical protein T492DRAFT_854244 [Pavlovales sp. CCMP2436]